MFSKCWIPFTDFIKWLDDASAIDFTVRSQRTGIMDQFNAIRTYATTNPQTRVSDDFWMICIRDSDWPSKESRLRAVTATRPTGRNVPFGVHTEQAPEQIGSDPILSYYRLVEDMKAQLERGIGLYNKDRFEATFQWQ